MSILIAVNIFEEKPISRWMIELVSRNDHKNLIPKYLNLIIF